MDKQSELQNTIINLSVKVNNLESRFLIEEIILNSEYKILTFAGLSDGIDLVAQFDVSLFQNRKMLVKSIAFVPYYNVDSEDIRYSDGTTETILDQMRINRVFDWFGDPPAADVINTYIAINDRPIISVPPGSTGGSLPIDFKADNIYYLVPNIVKSIIIRMGALVPDNIATGNRVAANMKCLLEVYLFND